MKPIQIWKQILASLLLLSTSLSLHAKDYEIEVILFTHTAGINQPSEQAVLRQIEPKRNGKYLGKKGSVRALSRERYRMGGIARRLTSSPEYKVLKHIAWRQPALSKRQAYPIQIRAGKDYQGEFPTRSYRPVEFGDTTQSSGSRAVYELEGTLTVTVGRYLHIYSDLVYRLPQRAQYASAGFSNRVLADYHVKSHRRMRSKELHYVDHPIVGMIVEATPIEEE